MKRILLLRNNIAHLFRSERIAALIIVCSLFCVDYAQFSFSGLINHLTQMKRAGSNYTSICITPHSENHVDEIMMFFESSPLGEMQNAFVIDLDASGERPQMVGWKGTAFTRWEALEAGMSFFSAEQVESYDHIAIMSVTSLGERPNSRNINGTKYEIIEHGNLSTAMLLRKFQTSFNYFTDEYGNNDELIIPYHTFFHDGFVPDAIVLDLCQALKGSEQEIVQQVADYFPDCDISLVGYSSKTQNSMNEYKSIQILFVFLCLLSALSIFALYNGWVQQNAKQYQAFILSGAKKTSIYGLIFAELGFFVLIAAFLAVLAVHFSDSLYIKIGLAIDINLLDCCGIILIDFILSCISIIKTIHNVCTPENWKGQ